MKFNIRIKLIHQPSAANPNGRATLFRLTYILPAPHSKSSIHELKLLGLPISFHRIFSFDSFSPSIHNSLYDTCGGRISPRISSRSITDGAKIYFCYRRCCFLTWEGRSCLLHRLSPRKSWLQSHPAKVRSVP